MEWEEVVLALEEEPAGKCQMNGKAEVSCSVCYRFVPFVMIEIECMHQQCTLQ